LNDWNRSDSTNRSGSSNRITTTPTPTFTIALLPDHPRFAAESRNHLHY
jgi:hypothetical protein